MNSSPCRKCGSIERNNAGKCRLCTKRNKARRYKEISGHIKDLNLKRIYGITLIQFKSMVDSQRGVCVICQLNPATDVDHCHITGKIRGILCPSCNNGLGRFKENPISLENAASYLRKHA